MASWYSLVILSKRNNYDYRYSDLKLQSLDQPKLMSLQDPTKAKLLGEGVIKLYREFAADDEEDEEETPITDATTVSILAVPTYFTAVDLLGFIGESYLSKITHIRILKSEKPNRFLVLLQFEAASPALQFYHQFNGKPFNSMEPESCHVVFIKSIKMDGISNKDMTPFLIDDLTSENQVVELPTCPVCLERMDSTLLGLLTIPCLHTFHCQCLSKWVDDSCPICRYSNNISNQKVRKTIRKFLNISLSRNIELPETSEHSHETCSSCDTTSELWICLICGNVGCSRYSPQKHSLQHFIDAGHCFAMEISTSRVWDYAGDNYVHRLITNESDGKLVELPDKNSTLEINDKINSSSDKVEQVGFEYSQLLISQLASQREYYEQLILGDEKSKIGSSRNDKLEARLTSMELSISNLQSKIKAKDEKLNIISKNLNDTNLLNEALSKKVEFLEEANLKLKNLVQSTNTEKEALSEQVTDLMFFLDNQEKFKDQPDDVRDGTLVLRSKPGMKNNLKKKKK